MIIERAKIFFREDQCGAQKIGSQLTQAREGWGSDGGGSFFRVPVVCQYWGHKVAHFGISWQFGGSLKNGGRSPLDPLSDLLKEVVGRSGFEPLKA